MSTNGLFKYGALRKQFLQNVGRSPVLQALWSQQNGKSVNSPSTLPLDIQTKDQIYLGVALLNEGKLAIEIKAKQGFAYAKELMKFYKHGVSAVWNNHKHVKRLTKDAFQISGSLDRKGENIPIRIPNANALTQHMAQALYMNLTENRAQKEATTGDVVRTDSPLVASVSPKLFNVSRAEYQLVRRTPPDFIKIPMFAVIFTLFMEMTPVLCYAFPEVTPLTCVLPLLLPRIWRQRPLQNLRKEITHENTGSLEDYIMKTAYNLPTPHVRLLCEALRLKTKYVPTSLFPEFVLRKRLHNYFNYLTVDNYYLSGMNGDGNVWNLDIQELVLACLERNLVADPKLLVEKLSMGPLEYRQQALDELRVLLVRFIADFSSANVGYLAVGHLLEQPDVKAVLGWRK